MATSPTLPRLPLSPTVAARAPSDDESIDSGVSAEWLGHDDDAIASIVSAASSVRTASSSRPRTPELAADFLGYPVSLVEPRKGKQSEYRRVEVELGSPHPFPVGILSPLSPLDDTLLHQHAILAHLGPHENIISPLAGPDGQPYFFSSFPASPRVALPGDGGREAEGGSPVAPVSTPKMHLVVPHCAYTADDAKRAHYLSDSRSAAEEAAFTYKRDVLVRDMLRALDHCHTRGVVHRDMKADNMGFLPSAGGPLCAKLLDWGLAAHMVAIDPGQEPSACGLAPQRTAADFVRSPAGAPFTWSPELIRDQRASARTDRMALGYVVYAMATGGLHPMLADLATANPRRLIPLMLGQGVENPPDMEYEDIKHHIYATQQRAIRVACGAIPDELHRAVALSLIEGDVPTVHAIAAIEARAAGYEAGLAAAACLR